MPAALQFRGVTEIHHSAPFGPGPSKEASTPIQKRFSVNDLADAEKKYRPIARYCVNEGGLIFDVLRHVIKRSAEWSARSPSLMPGLRSSSPAF
jgi:hypothetical protein